ncbi:BnaC01g20520D [Brassica napus]|uniref:BnaC01g20520D protein n=1 Tax=Brassica napus TaxID=3708 RepID=A0A078G174_BRANA|nr:BnaC01g20520D [Brassica napus]
MQDCSPDIQQFDNLFKSYKLSDETGCLCFGLSKLSLARQMIRQFCSADGKKRSKLYTGLQADLVKAPELTSDQQLLDTTFHGCEQDLLVKSVMETVKAGKPD